MVIKHEFVLWNIKIDQATAVIQLHDCMNNSVSAANVNWVP